jgi:hypothetical protein
MCEAKNVATLCFSCFSNNQIMKIMSQGINNLDCYLLQQKCICHAGLALQTRFVWAHNLNAVRGATV